MIRILLVLLIVLIISVLRNSDDVGTIESFDDAGTHSGQLQNPYFKILNLEFKRYLEWKKKVE